MLSALAEVDIASYNGISLFMGDVMAIEKHGATAYSADPLLRKAHGAWVKLRQRCDNPKVKHFEDYGGRGIVYDTAWLSFGRFLADMGLPPSKDHSLDRIDNDGPYSAANCRWATSTQQMQNRRFNINLTHDGKTQCLAEWARELGVSDFALYARIRTYGWSVEKALTQPFRRSSKTQGGTLGVTRGGEETENLVGVKVGRLTIIEFAGIAPNRVSMWKCRCDCGVEKIIRRSNLFPGGGKVNTLSCGCHRKDVQRQRLTGHNVRRTLNS